MRNSGGVYEKVTTLKWLAPKFCDLILLSVKTWEISLQLTLLIALPPKKKKTLLIALFFYDVVIKMKQQELFFLVI